MLLKSRSNEGVSRGAKDALNVALNELRGRHGIQRGSTATLSHVGKREGRAHRTLVG
jgi:hypothetical protein